MKKYFLMGLAVVFVLSFSGQCSAGGHHRSYGRYAHGSFGRDFSRSFQRNLERNLDIAATVAITELTVMAIDGVDRAIRGTYYQDYYRSRYVPPVRPVRVVYPRDSYVHPCVPVPIASCPAVNYKKGSEEYWRDFIRQEEIRQGVNIHR